MSLRGLEPHPRRPGASFRLYGVVSFPDAISFPHFRLSVKAESKREASVAENQPREAGEIAGMTGSAENLPAVDEYLVTGEVQARTLLALSNTHSFHMFMVSKGEPTLNHWLRLDLSSARFGHRPPKGDGGLHERSASSDISPQSSPQYSPRRSGYASAHRVSGRSLRAHGGLLVVVTGASIP